MDLVQTPLTAASSAPSQPSMEVATQSSDGALARGAWGQGHYRIVGARVHRGMALGKGAVGIGQL
jgi:hypothetical protein